MSQPTLTAEQKDNLKYSLARLALTQTQIDAARKGRSQIDIFTLTENYHAREHKILEDYPGIEGLFQIDAKTFVLIDRHPSEAKTRTLPVTILC
ncbi:MAG: hypothetical protein F6J87_30165 [Spirulina sp. SIO3F2]|nr:hypothetical protein [Spirulina sp. SIO3F2]